MGGICCKSGLHIVEVDPNHTKPSKGTTPPESPSGEETIEDLQPGKPGSCKKLLKGVPAPPGIPEGLMNPMLAAACIRKKVALFQGKQVDDLPDTSFRAAVEKAGGPSNPALMVSKKAAAAQQQPSPPLQTTSSPAVCCSSENAPPSSGSPIKSKRTGFAATWSRLARSNGMPKQHGSTKVVKDSASLESILESATHGESEQSSDKPHSSSGKAAASSAGSAERPLPGPVAHVQPPKAKPEMPKLLPESPATQSEIQPDG